MEIDYRAEFKYSKTTIDKKLNKDDLVNVIYGKDEFIKELKSEVEELQESLRKEIETKTRGENVFLTDDDTMKRILEKYKRQLVFHEICFDIFSTRYEKTFYGSVYTCKDVGTIKLDKPYLGSSVTIIAERNFNCGCKLFFVEEVYRWFSEECFYDYNHDSRHQTFTQTCLFGEVDIDICYSKCSLQKEKTAQLKDLEKILNNNGYKIVK